MTDNIPQEQDIQAEDSDIAEDMDGVFLDDEDMDDDEYEEENDER